MYIEVRRESGPRFRATVGPHEIVYDQPVTAGGTDAGPTPTDAFVASLAACVAHYATQFLVRHGRSAEGLRVSADFTMAQHPSRVGAIAIDVHVAEPLSGSESAALHAVVEHCTVHSSIVSPPAIRIAVSTPEPVLAR